MHYEFDTRDLRRRAALLRGAGDQIEQALERTLTERGADAVRFIQRRHRQGGTSATRTARRQGRLYDAYDSLVDRFRGTHGRGFDLHVGGIKPGTDDQTLVALRVHEGIDRNGNPVEKFVIRPINSAYLHFKLPPEKGGGWVRVKEVTVYPRPALPAVEERLPPVIEADFVRIFDQVTGQ